MRQLITIDDLTGICGYFNGAVSVNNGYGCNHPDQEETDIDRETGKEQGKCYCHSCPIAYQADYEDMQNLDAELAEEYKNDIDMCNNLDTEWMVYDDGEMPGGEG
jgi:hypothetical protein